ncbi:LacI family DNA-binding transcriptional regulator [Actinoalloteichus caeruleus]|uniref:LacI family DNA-binding transcriptional regulator n=1 Tax=Actinoalloteichus cyanogriseus TaxID=2893586 RepID=UPI00068F487E|nr:LacI family DNA-binding transcriptional regulator [Actinoalloteichus caeruleus]
MPGTAHGGPTLAVIAREAGVSVPTVSKVVNGREDVAPHTRRRVSEVLERRGYMRRPVVRAPRDGVGGPIDVVIHGLGASWATTILSGVEDAAYRVGLDIVVSAARTGTGHTGRGWLDRVADRGTAGVLLVLVEPTPSQREWLRHHRIPYVVLDPVSVPPPGVPSVGATNWAGGVSATEHLLRAGHRRIAVVSGPEDRLCGQARLAGYRSAMAAAGLPVLPELIAVGDFTLESGRRRAGDLLDLPEPPTAVFACTDQMALGVCDAARERGLTVPEDLSVVGFDDLPEARWARPALTTVRQPLNEMASAAIGLLVRLMRGETAEADRIELSTCLVKRASTSAPSLGFPAPRRGTPTG